MSAGGSDRGEHGVPIAGELGLANAVNLGELGEVPWPRGRDPSKRRIVEDDIGRNAGLGGERPPRCAQRFEQRVGGAGIALAAPASALPPAWLRARILGSRPA